MGAMKLPLLFFSWCWLWYLCKLFHMLKIWSLYCFSLILGTLGWLLLDWVYWISHFWMVTCSDKLSCLGLEILSMTLWIFCMAWIYIHISHAPWFFGWIVQCPQFVHLQCMYADVLVIKILEGVQINHQHVSQWWLNPCLDTWLSLCLDQRLSHIFFWFCILVLAWNICPWFCLYERDSVYK